MHTFFPIHIPTSKLRRMDHNARLKLAITDLESQSRVNYAAVAKNGKSIVQRCYDAIKVKPVLEKTQSHILIDSLQIYKKSLLSGILII
jgi:hypothetical protein